MRCWAGLRSSWRARRRFPNFQLSATLELWNRQIGTNQRPTCIVYVHRIFEPFRKELESVWAFEIESLPSSSTKSAKAHQGRARRAKPRELECRRDVGDVLRELRIAGRASYSLDVDVPTGGKPWRSLHHKSGGRSAKTVPRQRPTWSK